MPKPETSPKRRSFPVYTTASPIFGALIAVFGVIILLLVNAAAGAMMAVLGVLLCVVAAMAWVFDKEGGYAARVLRWRTFSYPLWQRPLSEIAAIEIMGLVTKDTDGTLLDDTRTVLMLKNGERRSMWAEHSDRSRDLARFLAVKLVEQKAAG